MTSTPTAFGSSSARSYQQVLTKLLRHNALPQLRKIIDKTLPADISPVLPLLLEDDQRKILGLLVESGKAGRVLLELDEDEMSDVIAAIDDPLLAAICSSSAPDDAADLLDLLDEDRREQVLAMVGEVKGASLEALLEHEDPTAGSLMNTEFLALEEEVSVATAISRIREYPRKESFFYVYIVDGEHQLVGVLSLRNLILADVQAQLKSIMVQHVVRASIDTPQEEVARLVAKYDLLSIPWWMRRTRWWVW